MKRVLLIFFLHAMFSAAAQQKILTEEELISIIMKFHPVARQAGNDVNIAQVGILSARAGFDPLLSGENAQKEFTGLTYYDHQVREVKIPTWYGIDVYTGQEKITGNRVNPEETRGSVTYVGFSVQPLQNLLIDERRAALLQAKNFHQLSELQRRIAINDLIQAALYAYWEWWEKYHVKKIVQAALLNAEKRLNLVKTAFSLGERPAIDTLEAYTQVQGFQIKSAETEQELLIATLQLSTFLWSENNRQADFPLEVIPQEFKEDDTLVLEKLINLVNVHPALRQYDFKLKEFDINKKLAFQKFLPEMKLKYNQTGYDFRKTLNGPWFNNNYRFGLSFLVPLRLSEARGEYKTAKLKMENTRLEQENKQVQLNTKIKQYYTEWQQTQKQLNFQLGYLSNTKTLQRGEETRFINGESSLFLVNTRELKTIEAEQKAIELKTKVQKAVIGLKWAAGAWVKSN